MLWSMVAHQPEVLVVVPQAEVTQIGQVTTKMQVTNCQVNNGIK